MTREPPTSARAADVADTAALDQLPPMNRSALPEGGRAKTSAARRRRMSRLALVIVLPAVAVTVALTQRTGTQQRAPAALAMSQWQHLTQRITGSAGGVSALRAEPLSALPAAVDSPSASASARRSWQRPDRETLVLQAAAYDDRRTKGVVELQKFRHTTVARVADEQGRTGTAELVNLNPTVNSWYLLHVTWEGEATTSYHLTNSRPEAHDLVLDSEFPGGLLLEDARGRTGCDLWWSDGPASLAVASRASTPYVTLCGDDIVLRRPTAGRRTNLEWATDLLRDRVWGGEQLTVLVRDSLYSDAHLVTSTPIAGAGAAQESVDAPGTPRPARIAAEHAGDLLEPVGLALALAAPTTPRVGAWYAARDNPGVFVSVLQPGMVSSGVLEPGPRGGGRLDAVEAVAMTYLVAFDLADYEVDYSVGTDHPRVGWSERVRPEMRDSSLPGPDGIGDIAPLVAGGIVPYSLAESTVASFTGGFKRSHGGFKSGALAQRNSGSHYGFVESGVVLSKLQPGLATVFVLADGTVAMKTWSRDDDALLERVKFARQNGVAIVETDPATGAPVAGALVTRWADGNWSGSQDRRLRSVRAGICLQESEAGRFLLYGYFSSATPTAMARVFQAYGCSYAMITDMNALEHTYLALYRVEESRLVVDHLIEGMDVLDKVVHAQVLPRFLGFADNRDLFYVVRRQPPRDVGRQMTARDPAEPEQGAGR